MPRSEMTHEDEYKLPRDVPLPAQLSSVKEKSYPRKDGSGEFTKWVWEFEITDGEYAGLHAWGDTEPKLTNHPDNRVRQWGETLRGSEYEMGEGLDTDDLLGLPCLVVVDNIKEEKQGSPGEYWYRTPIKDVYGADAIQDIEPPF